MKKYNVYLTQEGEDVILPLPEELIASLGWREGDTLVWEVDPVTEQIILRKKLIWYREIIHKIKLWIRNIRSK